MGGERKEPRKRVLKTGTIILGADAKIPCTVRNLSETGARLELQGTFAIPPTFLLIISGQSPRQCKLLWRTDARIGVLFLGG
jgi:hypothetical protein